MLLAALSAVTTALCSISDSFAQESGLQTLGMNTFYNNDQYNPALHIVGEVLNKTTEIATFGTSICDAI
jgi:hypothetical protein